jgi:hypothetical protein
LDAGESIDELEKMLVSLYADMPLFSEFKTAKEHTGKLMAADDAAGFNTHYSGKWTVLLGIVQTTTGIQIPVLENMRLSPDTGKSKTACPENY